MLGALLGPSPLLRSLGNKPFALMWTGQSISRLGDSLYTIALAWWVLQKTGSAAVMGTVLIFSMMPMLVFLLIGGVVVDRFPRIRVMIASDVLSGTVVVVVAILAIGNLLEVWQVYVASAIFGLVAAFFQPAYTAAVPEVTPEKDLPSANSLTSLSRQLAGIAGPALGAAIVASAGSSTAFAIDGLSFFVSALCLGPVSRSCASPRKGSVSSGALHDLREGIGAVLGSPWLWVTIAIASLGNIALNGPLNVALPFLVRNDLKADVGLLGTLLSLASVGSVGAAIWLGRRSTIRKRGLAAYVAWTVGGAMILASGLVVAVLGSPVAIVGLVLAAPIFGAAMATFGLIWTNTLQELVPRDLLGRVSSVDYLGSFALLPIGFGITGWATDRFGAPLVFVAGGFVGASLSLLGLLHPQIRKLD